MRARLGLFVLSLNLGFVGFLLVMFWAMEVYGTSRTELVEDQPAPAWLWQLGVAFGVLGAALLGALYVRAGRWPLGAEATRPDWLAGPAITAIVLVETVLCAVVASAASTESVHRWWPLPMAALMCVAGIVIPRWQR